jgi:hypothetical protein
MKRNIEKVYSRRHRCHCSRRIDETLGNIVTEAEFECKNGRRVWIEIDEDDNYAACVRLADDREIGRLRFRMIEDDSNNFLKLSWAYLDLASVEFKRQGIGRECLSGGCARYLVYRSSPPAMMVISKTMEAT